MKAKLKVIKNWEFEEFELTGTSFKYSPTGCKGMVARSEDEIVFWTYHLAQKCSGVLWVKGDVSRWIPSPEPEEQQDVWEVPVLLSCDRGILLICPASKSLWLMPQIDGEWIPVPMDNWCTQGIPKPVAVTGSQGVFPIVCRVDNYADATNSFTTLTVNFEAMTAHWAESGSCVYSKAGTRQTHLAAVERAGGNSGWRQFCPGRLSLQLSYDRLHTGTGRTDLRLFGKQHHQSGGPFSHGLLLVSGTGGKWTIQKETVGQGSFEPPARKTRDAGKILR